MIGRMANGLLLIIFIIIIKISVHENFSGHVWHAGIVINLQTYTCAYLYKVYVSLTHRT